MTDIICLIIGIVIGTNLEVFIMSLCEATDTSTKKDGNVCNRKQQNNNAKK